MSAGRFIVKCFDSDVEVLGETFTIGERTNEFIVHRSVSNDPDAMLYTVTHIATGFCFGYGDTIDQAILYGTARWNLQPKRKIIEAIAKAKAIADARVIK